MEGASAGAFGAVLWKRLCTGGRGSLAGSRLHFLAGARSSGSVLLCVCVWAPPRERTQM
eukprot:COSAG03_NODE_24309_length_273_cov_0.724138_1_plen_58_part_10